MTAQCRGCVDGLAVRACAITGDPIHRGPDHSFPCTAPREVTVETLTDEQILALQRSIAGSVFPASGMAHTALSILWHYTEDALAVDPNCYASTEAAGRAYRIARARVADAINARAKAGR